MIINGKKFDLTSNINKNQLNNGILEIKLKGIKNITNMSYMFHRCDRLKSLPDISKWNTQNVIDMNSIFYKCKSLVSLPDISKWDTSLIDKRRMFHKCNKSLKIPIEYEKDEDEDNESQESQENSENTENEEDEEDED